MSPDVPSPADGAAYERYRELGVSRDVNGDELKPSSLRLPHLSESEGDGCELVATAGDVVVRRVEQERIAMEDAARAVMRVANRFPRS